MIPAWKIIRLLLPLAACASCIATLPSAPCIDDSDCREGACGPGGYCTASTGDGGRAVVDAGDGEEVADAGVADAGTRDAGRPDAGRIDGGAFDAGEPADASDGGAVVGDSGVDAGSLSSDAGEDDAGLQDAGVASDAGELDSGSIDDAGQVVDSGQADAGAGVCGDGYVDLASNETCDPGPGGDGGSACVDCQTQSGFACVLSPSVCVPDAQFVSVVDGAANAVTDALATLSPAPGKTVVIEASGGPYDTIGNQDGEGRIIIIGSPTVTFFGAGPEAFKAKNDTELVLKNVIVSATANTFLIKVEGSLAKALVEDSLLGPTGGGGASMKAGGQLTIRRSVLFGAAAHGIIDDGTGNDLILENSLVVESGEDGLHLLAGNTATIVFSTIANNTGAGVSCPTTGVTVNASLLANNAGGDVVGACAVTASVVSDDGGTAGFAGGDAGVLDRYRINEASDCFERVDDGTGLPAEDVDLDVRPSGAGIECGADEIP